ncbi:MULTISPECIES: transglutaminase domain-containing protein [Mesorhizobium]|uniref:transglutaminase domain-containing protein n=2 Tax=Phyllobacteriaceae TaxID=69277 RepID=UPI0010A97210|nr:MULTISPECIES: transglutaminase family protein [Mesorhizobium]
MNRRMFLIGAGATALAPSRVAAQGQTPQTLDARIANVQRELQTQRADGKTPSCKWIAEQLQVGLTDRDRRIAAFKIVQEVPYKLTAWTGNPDSLFAIDRGDCRHKSAALIQLMRAWKVDARPVQVPFNWADLPIPQSVLQPLAETRGFHDTVEVDVDGKMILVDATWDLALGKAGFPVLANWNGVDPTPAITPRAKVILREGDIKAGTDLYAYFGFKWPERKRTLAFNRAFNAWTDELRARENAVKG